MYFTFGQWFVFGTDMVTTPLRFPPTTLTKTILNMYNLHGTIVNNKRQNVLKDLLEIFFAIATKGINSHTVGK